MINVFTKGIVSGGRWHKRQTGLGFTTVAGERKIKRREGERRNHWPSKLKLITTGRSFANRRILQKRRK